MVRRSRYALLGRMVDVNQNSQGPCTEIWREWFAQACRRRLHVRKFCLEWVTLGRSIWAVSSRRGGYSAKERQKDKTRAPKTNHSLAWLGRERERERDTPDTHTHRERERQRERERERHTARTERKRRKSEEDHKSPRRNDPKVKGKEQQIEKQML